MRQLKGKVKETPMQRKERKKEFRENKENIMKVAIPALIISVLVVFFIVYSAASRPKSYWIRNSNQLGNIITISLSGTNFYKGTIRMKNEMIDPVKLHFLHEKLLLYKLLFKCNWAELSSLLVPWDRHLVRYLNLHNFVRFINYGCYENQIRHLYLFLRCCE
jgi:hypothetical protein